MSDRDDDERRDRNQRAAAAALGAAAGGVIAGPVGVIAGAALGPMLEPLVQGAWAEISASARQRQTDVLFSAIHAGVPIEEMEERINASERTKLLTGLALSAAGRTAWEDKVRTLGRSLAAGLLAEDNVKIDTEQMIIAAIADIEAPHLAMLELLVAYIPSFSSLTILEVPKTSQRAGPDGDWGVAGRNFRPSAFDSFRPNLAPLAPSLLGTLQRHGLATQNDGYWSPTEFGEKVFLRFRDAGAKLEDVWSAGPADVQK